MSQGQWESQAARAIRENVAQLGQAVTLHYHTTARVPAEHAEEWLADGWQTADDCCT